MLSLTVKIFKATSAETYLQSITFRDAQDANLYQCENKYSCDTEANLLNIGV